MLDDGVIEAPSIHRRTITYIFAFRRWVQRLCGWRGLLHQPKCGTVVESTPRWSTDGTSSVPSMNVEFQHTSYHVKRCLLLTPWAKCIKVILLWSIIRTTCLNLNTNLVFPLHISKIPNLVTTLSTTKTIIRSLKELLKCLLLYFSHIGFLLGDLVPLLFWDLCFDTLSSQAIENLELTWL